MRVHVVPCLADNYAYLLDDGAGCAVAVDPSEAPPVEAALHARGLVLTGIWLTHHHWDHTGGVVALCDGRAGREGHGKIDVLGSAYDLEHGRIARQTRGLRQGDALSFAGRRVELLEIPGHTLGAIAYVVDGCLFSGDTLFLAGCGRVFEGTMPMMQASLAKLSALAPDTRVYCGHEYTAENLKFAATVEPDNRAVRERASAVAATRVRGESTVPGTLRDELATNPFLRWDAPGVIAHARACGAQGTDPGSVFGAIRRAKDAFRS